MDESVLFVINGFGMGNATRCDSLMDILEKDYKIDVITSDKAFLYFQQNSKISNLYKQENINLEKKVKYGSWSYYFHYMPHFFKRLFKNYSTQKQILNSTKYKYVFFDSDYCFIAHRILSNRKNIIAINNSYEIIKYILSNPSVMRLDIAFSLLIEICDFVMHYIFCRYIICPCLDYNFDNKATLSLFKILKFPPLVRRSLMFKQSKKDKRINILAVSSSSSIDMDQATYKIPQNEFIIDNTQQLVDADLVVCNSGQSTLSECLYLNKKTVVVPLHKHAEQYVNSLIAKSKGLILFENGLNFEELAQETSRIQYNYLYDQSVKVIKNYFKVIEKEIYDHLR